MEHILQLSKSRKCAKRNIPIIINRWAEVKNFVNDLYKWDVDPAYAYKTTRAVPGDILDLNSGKLAKNCEDPNRAFINLTAFYSTSAEEIRVYTDGSRAEGDEGITKAGASVWIPELNHVDKYKLNRLSSSFTAEAIAIIKALDHIVVNGIKFANICTDSLSVLKALGSSGSRKHKLCPLINDIKSRMAILTGENSSQQVRFTWCPAHVGIMGNERADREAREAASSGQWIDNKVL